MKESDLEKYQLMLGEMYDNVDCDFDCYNCELGIYENLYSSASCAIEAVEQGLRYKYNEY